MGELSFVSLMGGEEVEEAFTKLSPNHCIGACV